MSGNTERSPKVVRSGTGVDRFKGRVPSNRLQTQRFLEISGVRFNVGRGLCSMSAKIRKPRPLLLSYRVIRSAQK